MPRFEPLRHLALLVLVGCAAPSRFEFERPAMGTTFRLVLYAEDAARAERAAGAAFARIEALDDALSDYDPDSELSRLSARSAGVPRTGPVPVSDDLWVVLAGAEEVSRATGGAFDVTVGPCVRLWRRAARQGVQPSAERLQAALAAVGWEHVRLDPGSRTVELDAADMRLDLGGIAKGYALDEALAALARHGVVRALVDGGGDVAAGAPPPGARGWRVAVAISASGAPEATVLLAHAACATSGDAFRFVEFDGVRFSHVVDPRTGLGLTTRRAATVIAPTGMRADALASALCVLELEQGLGLVERLVGTEARVWRTSSEKGPGEPCDSSGFAGRMAR